MARFRLELGPVPLHHQVYLDLRAALDGGRVAARATGCPPSASSRAATAAASSPSGAPSTSSPASSASSGPAAAARSCSRRASTATSTGTMSFTEEMQTRGLDPRDAAPRGATGVRRARRSPRRCDSSRARPRSTSNGCGWRRRAAPARAGPPPGRALPRPAGVGPRAQLAVRPADDPLRHAHRASPRDVRAGAAQGPRGPPAGQPPRTPALLVEGIAFADDGSPVEFGAHLRPRRPHALLRRARRRALELAAR